MNVHPKPIIMTIVILLISCSAWSSENEVQVSSEEKDQCKEATYGRLDLGTMEFKNPGQNAFLLNCSLSAVVPEPGEKLETYDKYIRDKQTLASFLLTKNLDVNYRDSHGSTLLMSAIVSYFPGEWKEKTAKNLIEKGCNVNAVNNYGRTAIDLARFKKNEKLLKLLSNVKN